METIFIFWYIKLISWLFYDALPLKRRKKRPLIIISPVVRLEREIIKVMNRTIFRIYLMFLL